MSPVTAADGGYLRALLGVGFTDEQLAIITHPLQPQLVVAGAGSGKTTVMAARVVHAVAHFGLAPERVLGLTFTNKAAGELADRVRAALGRLTEEYDDEPTVATYHAYAARLVRDHALRVGREPLSDLLTEAGRWQLAMQVVRGASDRFEDLNWTAETVARYLLDLDADLAEHCCDIATVRAFDADLLAECAASPRLNNDIKNCAAAARSREELLTLVERYRKAKADAYVIDYGDQVALAAEIAAVAPEVGRAERDRFGLVVLDEYQDTGVAQRELLSRLFGGGHPVTAVGDPNQAIYGWRGASVGNLLRFPQHFPVLGGGRASPQPLVTSFRCGGRILSVANAVAGPLRDSAAGHRRPRLDVPQLRARPGAGDCGETVVALLDTVAAEADWVAGQVARAVYDEGVPPGEVAVLCRASSAFAGLHRALLARELPVEVVGLGGLLEMPEVSDVVATLRLLVDGADNPSLVRLLTGPRWRLGPRDLAALGRRAAALCGDRGRTGQPADPLLRAIDRTDPVDTVSLLDAVDSPGPAALSAAARARLAEFSAELAGLRGLAGQPVVDVVAEVVSRIGLDVEIEAELERVAAARAANLAAFADHAAQFTGFDGRTDLTAFLAFLEAAADAENGLDVGAVSAADTVKLLTVHKAKGLEWRVVSVPGLAAKVFPAERGRRRWSTAAAVLPNPLRGDASDLPPRPALTSRALAAFGKECAADDADEERRLGYVAFTRARERLLLSGYWWGETQKGRKGPSVLLEEVAGLGSPLVRVDRWVPEEVVGEHNPLAAQAGRDVPWPAPYDPAALARRRHAAELVRAAPPRRPPLEHLDEAVRAQAHAWYADADALLAELCAGRAPVREVQLPRRLTTTQVVALRADPDGLARSLARPLPAAPAAAARRGTRFHRWVESRYGQRPLLDPDEPPGAGEPDPAAAELAELQDRFLESPYGARDPVAIEAPFELVVGGRVLRGRIDAVYADPDGFDVIDFKTGQPPRDFAAAALQLSVYRLAWADLAGVEPAAVRAGFLYVRPGELRRPDRLLDRAELAELLGS